MDRSGALSAAGFRRSCREQVESVSPRGLRGTASAIVPGDSRSVSPRGLCPQARSAGRKAFGVFSNPKQEQGRFATRASPAFWRGTFVNRDKSTQKRFSNLCELGGVARETRAWRNDSLSALRHEKLVTRQLSATGWGIGARPAWGRGLRGHCRAGAVIVPRPPSVAWRLRSTASPESRSITDSWRHGIGRETRPSIRPACKKRFCLLLSRLTKEGRPQARSAGRKVFRGWFWFSIPKQEQRRFATRAAPACWRGTFDSRLKSTQKRSTSCANGAGLPVR